MDRSEFTREADRAFYRLLDALDDVDPDVVEAERTADIVHILFSDGTRFVVNTQSAAHQIWLAGGDKAWHFDFDAGKSEWTARRNGDELFSTLTSLIARKIGLTIEF